MAKLIYSFQVSLDGYYEDADGKFGFSWAAPDGEGQPFVTNVERPIGTRLYGRRMYETMTFWETAGTDADDPEVLRDYGEAWRATDKIVYSTTVETPSTARTRIEHSFKPDVIRELKTASSSDILIGGGDLAAQAIRAGLVDEFHFYVYPVVVGAGKQALPDNVHTRLDLLDEHRFSNGVVHLHYRANTDDRGERAHAE